MTIKPEQVPKEVYDAVWDAIADNPVVKPDEIVAAALNAWPGKSFEEKHNLLTQTSHTNLVIPLGEA